MNSVDMANNLIFRAKNLHEFTVTTEVPEDFRFNGVVPFDMSIVDNQIEASKMKKGTTVSVIGRLLQERWKQDETSRNRVVIIAEHMTYGQRSNSSPKTDQASTETAQSNTSVPNSF